jgi:type II secretory ATPase GspE/PulE/Tfp pilus assembly ATPase PilB-like protein
MREIVLIKQVHDLLFPSLDTDPYDPFTTVRIIPFKQEATAELDTTNLLQFESQPVRDLTLKNPASGGVDADPPVTTALPVSNSELPADEKPAKRRVNWPKVRTQHDLLEYAELRHKGKHLYAQQGKSLGEILAYYQIIDGPSTELNEIIHSDQQRRHQPIGKKMVESGILSQEELDCALCIQAGTIMVDVMTIPIPAATEKTIPHETARANAVHPVGIYNNSLFLAVADPLTFSNRSFFTMLTGLKLELVYAPRNEIINRLNMHGYGFARSVSEGQEEFRNLTKKTLDFSPNKPVVNEVAKDDISENDSAIINLVNQMILHAIEEEASDIHIELFQGNTESNIRFRRDGHMEHFSDFPSMYHKAVISRLKIMAELDISEKRHPQDGKISFHLRDGKHIDLRIATVPTINSMELVTIRILPSGEPLPLIGLGMSDRDMKIFRKMFQHSFGLILACGPTGSGKTTTLHSVLKELNTDDRKIWTAEDPVEIVQPHLCQVQINAKIGVTFANMLRSFLRADPDIIMIGEMRDQETAKIALEASMTGHLVLSTLHTNSAAETVARLIDLDIDPYNLSDALLAILAQRLARKLCTSCAKREEAPAHEIDELANEYYQSAHAIPASRAEREIIIQQWREEFGQEGKLYLHRPVGCKICNSGYKGRIGLFELLQITPDLRHIVRQHGSASEYLKVGVAEGMRTLKQDGIEKVLSGRTDMLQVHSACV